MDYVDTIVVGAGVVGLATARALAGRGDSVVVVEAESHFGTGISSRNSEVIHAGIYYPAGSLKAQTCVQGKEFLYDYLSARQLPYKRCGKLIVASSQAQVADLERIKAKAEANGVNDLQWVSATEAARLEPEVSCFGALHSPSTGIIDSHAYMQSLVGDIEDAGGYLVVNTRFIAARRQDGFVVTVADTGAGDAPFELHCARIVNCGGLGAQDVARLIEGLDPAFIPPQYLAKGTYFSLMGKTPFSRLIYPVPEPGGLGVHVTLDMGGQAKFGPDVQWIDTIDFDPDPSRAERFYAAIRTYYPGLVDGALAPAYCGIRPKLSAPGAGDSDFVISGEATHGVPGLVNLFGIESPGLTASLAIAQRVVHCLHA